MKTDKAGGALRDLRERGMLLDVDLHFARLLEKLDPGGSLDVFLAAALASNATQKGNVCLDLKSIAGKPLPLDDGPETESLVCPDLDPWRDALKCSSVVGRPGDFKPLILDEKDRVYLYRYWHYERILSDFLISRSMRVQDTLDLPLLQQGLERLFPPQPDGGPDYQRIAVLVAVHRMLSVITGGPGTGKTSTVIKILVLLLEQAKGAKLRIALAAPTGKAAARLKEAVKKAKQGLGCFSVLTDLIPEEASTLHRLLGAVPHKTRFGFNSQNPLPHDVIAVDEASMIDLPLMAKLVQALAEGTRLILLGDKDQLASVQPGAVFGDICDTGAPHLHSARYDNLTRPLMVNPDLTLGQGHEQENLKDSIVVLQKSYRFVEGSGIGIVSKLVNRGDGELALNSMMQGRYEDISWHDLPTAKGLEDALEPLILEGYEPYLRAPTVAEAFEAFASFRILCALRRGPCGVEAVNQAAANILTGAQLIFPRGRWYRGQPVLITENDYQLKLFNGDIGIIFPDLEDPFESRSASWSFFPTEEGEFRRIPPLRLPEHETVFAMTVHKSQGSEFERILLLLPQASSELLTRELIYTAITRARKKVEIWGVREVFLNAVSRRTERKSGLRDALWKT